MPRFKHLLIFYVLFYYWKTPVLGFYRQKNAKVIYVNPKYLKDVKIFTYRPTRAAPYVTNLTGTIHHNWGNNITISIKMYSTKYNIGVNLLEMKLCEMFNIGEVKPWFAKYWGVSNPHCPLPADTYHMVAAEIPPKNFPFMLGKGDYAGGCLASHTNTKERIAEISFEISVDDNNKIKS